MRITVNSSADTPQMFCGTTLGIQVLVAVLQIYSRTSTTRTHKVLLTIALIFLA
jgi:hypothetical protein